MEHEDEQKHEAQDVDDIDRHRADVVFDGCVIDGVGRGGVWWGVVGCGGVWWGVGVGVWGLPVANLWLCDKIQGH